MPQPIIETTGVLTEKKTLSPDTRLFIFRPKQEIAFQPGQFMMINPCPDDTTYKRAFSVASAPKKDKMIELCIKIVPDGKVSPLIDQLDLGSELWIKGPYGVFTLRPGEREIIFIAGGTGIAPFRSMLNQLASEKTTRKCWLFYRFKNPEDFLFKEEFLELAKKYSWFTFVSSLSNHANDWQHETKRIHDVIYNYIAEPKKHDVYVCGPPLMVKETIASLIEQGFDPEHIYKEAWG